MYPLSVFVAKIPKNTPITTLSHPLRQNQIDDCLSYKVKEEKFFVWKLLEYAVNLVLGEPISNFDITLDKTGKWLSNGFEFSLSHSKGVVAVAISPNPVGVDIELIEAPKVNVFEKVLNDKQLKEFNLLPESEKIEYFITKWANKESVFKSKNLPCLMADNDHCDCEVFDKKMRFEDLSYILSVAGVGALSTTVTTVDFNGIL